jgi:type II secretory pathway component GspD/PulD (secretin)
VNLQLDKSRRPPGVQLYGKLTGFLVIPDNLVRGKVTMNTAEPVSRAQAISLIEKTLMNNAFSLVEKDKGVVEISGGPARPRAPLDFRNDS